MSKGLKALERIKKIELTHLGYDSDENIDGEWEYEAVEINDGTIEENYPQEINIIEKELKELEFLRNLKLLPYPKENDEEYRQGVIKRLMALEIIKDKFVWFENGKLYVGVRGDVEITLNEEDFDSEEEQELVKEVLK